MTVPAKFWLAVLVASVAGCATASHETRRSTSSTSAADNNVPDPAWASLDTNGDGYLSIDELEQQHAVALLQDMAVADTDADGRVSRAEWNVWWPLITKTEPSANMAALNASAAPTNGISGR